MLLSKLKRAEKHLNALPAFPICQEEINFILTPNHFKQQILTHIAQAKRRIYLTALYWEQDEAGQEIMHAVYQAKQANPQLEVKIFVDWHRAQRGRIGESNGRSNADWYAEMRQQYALDEVMVYGVPVNTREVFGVLHIKGFVFDDTILYSGASLNNVYLSQFERYRYDRYHLIHNPALANSMVKFLNEYLLESKAVKPLDQVRPTTKSFRVAIRDFRKGLIFNGQYHLNSQLAQPNQLKITPLFGLSRTSRFSNSNKLNKTIEALFTVVKNKLVICTPYFNFPRSLQQRLRTLLNDGKQVEIIVGDKTANDFYIPPTQPFKLIGALPYLYEKNLRHFAQRFAHFIQNGQLIIRLWKDGENSYHLKGIWVDDDYLLLTGNNLNPRAWRLDAENGLLIHDPQQQIQAQSQAELAQIRTHTTLLTAADQLEKMADYPVPVQKVLRRFSRIKADHIVKMIL
ncbi:phosphatidylserine synthase [Mergibacter septicus]|uniref:CDP-diacylglycerol--serine O-phosphatidyltransferase n=1 Tax=Mergibacter septicus TaxID=221402 RepID=UPI001C7425EE|nr:CDP-diacylglycerol--serine O-phosphatidyltransferase [Mergibacter septicus]QDJ12612.1 phosphatidylserine synthase [Mergibacter septicus]